MESEHEFTRAEIEAENAYIARHVEEGGPYLGQRCAAFADPEHRKMDGFGTIVDIKRDKFNTWVRVELDGGGSHWYELGRVELLETHHAG